MTFEMVIAAMVLGAIIVAGFWAILKGMSDID